MVEYTKTKYDNCVTYDFILDETNIRVNIYQKRKKAIEDTNHIPHVIYGELDNTIEAKYPLMGIKYTPVNVNKTTLITAVVDMVNLFLNEYNDKVQYEFIKVLRTENLNTKAEEYNQIVLSTISNSNITSKEIINNKGKGTNNTIIYTLNKN